MAASGNDSGTLVERHVEAPGTKERRAWLAKHRFNPDDPREVATKYFKTMLGESLEVTPMFWACKLGDLEMCSNLFDSGAAEDIQTTMYDGWTPMALMCMENKAGLESCQWLFEAGATTDITKANKYGDTPMYIACQMGQLSVCKWLFEVGAAADITKADSNGGFTPMWVACQKGHLSVCKWLLEVGAGEDITKATNNGFTPMYIACLGGHLPVCEWLFKVGAAKDITKATNGGFTPMLQACLYGRLSVCKWLVFNGALNTPPPAEHNDGHIDQAIVKRNTRNDNHRRALLAWAQDVAATHHTFLHVVLRASVILPESHHQASPDQRCHLPRLPRVVLERLGDLLGVEMGRRVRNVREFAEALAVVVEEARQAGKAKGR